MTRRIHRRRRRRGELPLYIGELLPILLGEVLTADTKTNVKMRMEAENGACSGKMKLAKRAKELGYDAIHDTVHEMAKDEARHGCGFQGLYNRFFKK